MDLALQVRIVARQMDCGRNCLQSFAASQVAVDAAFPVDAAFLAVDTSAAVSVLLVADASAAVDELLVDAAFLVAVEIAAVVAKN
jgi:hypothetical protein